MNKTAGITEIKKAVLMAVFVLKCKSGEFGLNRGVIRSNMLTK